MAATRSSHPASFFEKALLGVFPPPHYLEMPATALDLSDQVVRVVELKHVHKGLAVGTFGRAELPKEVIEEGYVKNKVELQKVLASLRAKHGLQFVNVSLPEEKTYLFRLTIPNMDPADIRNAIRFKIEENVPVSLADAVFDYYFITPPAEGDATIELCVTVIHSKVVSSYLDVISGAGLIPLQLSVESQAIARAVTPHGDLSTRIIVAVRETKTVFAIVSRGVVQFSSTLAIGGDSIATSIQKNFSVGKEEAETIRSGKEEKDRNEMFMSLVNAASVVRDEVKKMLVYWESHSDKEYKTVQKISVLGSDAMLGLHEYLGRSTGLPSEIANVWVNVSSLDSYIPPITRRESLNFAGAIGLALPYD